MTAAEFTAFTWAAGTTTTFTATAVTAGVDSAIAVSRVTASTGTFAIATTVAATGPNFWDNVNNWDTGSVPAAGDTANVNLSLGSVLYALDQNTVTLAALNIYTSSPTQNTLGLPPVNAAGYTEYMDQYLKIGATACKIDADVGRIKINFGSVATSTEVRRTGTSPDQPTPAVLLKGTSTSNVLDVVSGSVGAAYYDGDSFAAATITVGSAGTLVLGSGVSTATTITSLGTLVSNGVFTTLYVVGGQAAVNGSPGATTIDVSGGTLTCAFSGTAAAVLVGPGTLDATQDISARTFTDTTIRQGGQILDLPQATITYTNGVTRASGVVNLQAA